MDIDHGALIPVALEQMYPDARERAEVERLLDNYGVEPYHRERERVVLAVLYLVSREPEKLKAFVDLACTDYRDLLCAAEYPYSTEYWALRSKDPDEHRRLREKERDEYLSWVAKIRRST